MLKLKLLAASILMQTSMLAWSQPTPPASLVPPDPAPTQPGMLSNGPEGQVKPNAQVKLTAQSRAELNSAPGSTVAGLICTVFTSHFELLSLSFVLTAYSTYKVEPSCNEDYFYDLTKASITAQSRVVSGTTMTFRGGAHAYTMDVNLSPVSNPFFYIGNLKFSKVGQVKLNLMSIIKKRTWDIGNVVNATYSPFDSQSQIHYIWNTGTLIHRLVSPNGDNYVMYAYTNEVSKDLNRDNLVDLGGQLRLPEGWRYENVLLNKTITVRPTPLNSFGSDVLFDELNNYYIKYQK